MANIEKISVALPAHMLAACGPQCEGNLRTTSGTMVPFPFSRTDIPFGRALRSTT
jgi:hypothetical protein